MWLIRICHTFLHNFGDSSKTMMYGNNIDMPIDHGYNYFMLQKLMLKLKKLCAYS